MKLYASKFLAQRRNRIPVKDPIAGGPGRISLLAEIEDNALQFAESLLMDLDLPSTPEVSLGALKGFENVQKDPKTTNGVITVYASFHSLSGHKIRMDLFIPIVRGNFYKPSIAMINGSRCVFSQALINKLLDKVEGTKPTMHMQYSTEHRITHDEHIEKPMFSAPDVDGRWWSEVWNRYNMG